MFCEDFFETVYTFVVEEFFAVANPAESWWVEFAKASFVDKADVVHVGRSQNFSGVAVSAAQRFEQATTFLNQRLVC